MEQNLLINRNLSKKLLAILSLFMKMRIQKYQKIVSYDIMKQVIIDEKDEDSEEFSVKKNDIILLVVLLLIAGGSFLAYWLMSGEVGENGKIVISIEGETFGSYSLNKNQTISIPGRLGDNVLSIKDGYAKMESAECPDQVCVNHTAIHNKNDMIICLPNEIIVEVTEGEESKTDAIVQ